MDLGAWNQRYALEEAGSPPATPLLVEFASGLAPGTALDLACGAGRNALWLAERGWQVTAVDGAPAAVETLRRRSGVLKLSIKTLVADLERAEYCISPAAWDLILFCYYLQRDLFAPAQAGLKPGGVAIAIVHLTDPGEAATPTRAAPGELRELFRDCEVLHYREGASSDPAHARPVAEIIARRPT